MREFLVFVFCAAVIAAVIFAAGCSPQTHRFQLSGGETVNCRYQTFEGCGLTLTDCDTGYDYRCQQNVKSERW